MTTIHSTQRHDGPAAHADRIVRVRWTATVTAWRDRLGAFDGADGHRHSSVSLVIELRQDGERTGTLKAWLDLGERQRPVLPPSPVRWRAVMRDGLTHVDVFDDDARPVRLLALSIREGGRIPFAQSPLLAEAGFKAGTYDPPTVHVTATRGETARG